MNTLTKETLSLRRKYKKLLKHIPKMDKDTIKDISNQLIEEESFIDMVQDTHNWSDLEHDGLKAVLELPKVNGFYIDAYKNRVSYNGIKTLKRAGTELPTHLLHDIENKKCSLSFKYFRKHYCFITTKTGLARPEPRIYQKGLEDELLSLEDLIILYPRQSGKTVTVSTYLLRQILYHGDRINIGIVANKGATAREVLDKIKKIFQELPIWMMAGIDSWNKSYIEIENGTRIMAESPSSDSFRGYTINIIYEDESAYISGNLYDEYVDSVYPTMNSLIFKQVINSSTPKGMNHFYHLVQGATQNNKMEKPLEVTVKEDDIINVGGNGMSFTPEELYDYVNVREADKL